MRTIRIVAEGACQTDQQGLNVSCSCPDGQRQALVSRTRGRLIVCKHAAAALESVLDANPVEEEKRQQHQAKKRREREHAAKEQECKRQRQLQDEQLPGERERLE